MFEQKQCLKKYIYPSKQNCPAFKYSKIQPMSVDKYSDYVTHSFSQILCIAR